MKKLKKPGKKVIGIVAAVFVVVVGGIIALVLHMNREVAPWDTALWSTTRADIRSRFGEPDNSARTEERGGLNFDKYSHYEFLEMSGTIMYTYAGSSDTNTVTAIGWDCSLQGDKELREEQMKRLKNHLADRFGAPRKYENLDDFYHEDTWYDSDGKEITLLEYFYDQYLCSEVSLRYYFYSCD